MKGHLPLIAMRRQGARPDVVFLDVDADRLEQWRNWPADCPSRATVQVDPTDSPARLDLRFLIGLLVVVSGSDADRVQRIGQACQDAEALRVITTVHELRTRGPDVLATVVRFTDTDQESNTWPIC